MLSIRRSFVGSRTLNVLDLRFSPLLSYSCSGVCAKIRSLFSLALIFIFQTVLGLNFDSVDLFSLDASADIFNSAFSSHFHCASERVPLSAK